MPEQKPSCYISAIPGLIDSESDSGSSVVNNKYYADANGDIDLVIDGPYLKSDPDKYNRYYRIYVDQDTNREKFTMFCVDSQVCDEEDVDITKSAVYSVESLGNDQYETYNFKINHKDLLLARGTYFIHIYRCVSSTPDNLEWEKIKYISLTVRSDPIQGKGINDQYCRRNSLLLDILDHSHDPIPPAIQAALDKKQDILGYIPENVANKSDSYKDSSDITYSSTKALVEGLATKQSTLTDEQLSAVNSGITSDKINIYDNYSDDIMEKQNMTDESLQTNDKTIVGAINELNLSKGGTVVANTTNSVNANEESYLNFDDNGNKFLLLEQNTINFYTFDLCATSNDLNSYNLQRYTLFVSTVTEQPIISSANGDTLSVINDNLLQPEYNISLSKDGLSLTIQCIVHSNSNIYMTVTKKTITN